VPDRRALHLVHFTLRALDLLQDAASVVEEPLARLGRRGAAPVAEQQALAQLDLEPSHLAADRGLRDAEQPRGPGEAAEVDDGDEVLELPEVHARGGEREAGNGAATVRAAIDGTSSTVVAGPSR
jgi:hypothetical protein